MNQDQTHILGAKVDLLNALERKRLILQWLQGGRLHQIVTLNPEIALETEQSSSYRKIVNKADLTVVDGIGLIFGAFLLGTRMPKRCTGRQVLDEILHVAEAQGKSVFLLGGEGDTAKRAAKVLQKTYPKLQIAGATSGPQKDHFQLRDRQLQQQIQKSRADILLVAFGAPKQERWIQANKRDLRGVRLAIGVGGLFDYLAGNVANPPAWISRIGFEWLYRLITQPDRSLRIFRAVILFPFRCLVWRFRMSFFYRENVVGIIQNMKGEILLVTPFWAEGKKWQFPQGGVDRGESYEQGILREMREELGLSHLQIRDFKEHVYSYKWPKWYRILRGYRGQKQSVFLLAFEGSDDEIDITKEKELADWIWCPPQQLLERLSPPRKAIGALALRTFHLFDPAGKP